MDKDRIRLYTSLILALSIMIGFTPKVLFGSESEELSDEIESSEVELQPASIPSTSVKETPTSTITPSDNIDQKPENTSKSAQKEHTKPKTATLKKAPDQQKTAEQKLESKDKDKNEDKNENENEGKTDKPAPEKAQAINILGTEIPPGMSTRVAWRPGHSLKGLASRAPVLVVNGENPGPTLCITAAVHGDELNGIEVVRQVMHKVKAPKLNGALIGVPIVNIQGFQRNSRYLVDRRDLNRFFPGNPHGSLASRIAYSFFKQVIANCTALIDIHTGSFYRDNLPQLRADLRDESVVKLTEGISSALVLHSSGARGTLRKAAVRSNIPAVTLELGGPMILDEKAVKHGVEGILNLLNSLGMHKKSRFWGTPKQVYYHSQWVRAENGGIFFSRVKLGQKITPGDLLGVITNPITNEEFLVKSPYEGEVVGLAHNQVVYPGFATTHLAIKPTSDPQQQMNIPVSDDAEKEE